MGRYYWNRKTTIEECQSMNIHFLKEYGYLKLGEYKFGTMRWLRNGEERGSISISVDAENSFLRVFYISTDRQTGEKKEKDYNIFLTKTSCHYGGFRYWFICPVCNKKMGTLHLKGKSDFTCRHCLNLSYVLYYKQDR